MNNEIANFCNFLFFVVVLIGFVARYKKRRFYYALSYINLKKLIK